MFQWRHTICHLLLLCMLGAGSSGWSAEKTTTTSAADQKESTSAETKPPGTIDEAVKGYEKYAGFFTFYRKASAGETKLLLELREEQVNLPFFLESTFSTGVGDQVMVGEPVQNFILKWQRTPDDRLLLVTPNLGFRARAGSPQATAVARSFPTGFLAIFTIKARQPERKSLLIDVSDLFTGDFTGISASFAKDDSAEEKGGSAEEKGGSADDSFELDPEMTFLDSVKSFPENAVVITQFHFKRSASKAAKIAEENARANKRDLLADARSMPVRVVYNLWQMPAPGYHPRLADSRVGYFVVGQIDDQFAGYESFDDDMKANPNVYYINRWRLEKADPATALSPPKKPIVFWIDNSVPPPYRSVIRQGILVWNRAFERLGFKEALVVNEMPADANWDHADLSHNIIRWVATPWGSSGEASEGLFRENPLTGEIINAGIDINANLSRVARLEERDIVLPGARALKHGQFDYQQAMHLQGWYGLQALRTLQPGMNTLDETIYVNTMLASVVAHEMGHILGLRHNFMGSTYLTPEALGKPENMISSSLMDYTPFNIFALHHPGAPYFNPNPGKYDLWAIEYGYTPFNASTPEAEQPQLRAIAARDTEPGLLYGTDELADNYDPAIQLYDLSNDPLAYTETSFLLNRTLISSLASRQPAPGESYREFTLGLLKLLKMDLQAAGQATIYIGGMRVRWNHRGDPHEQPPLLPVPASEQYRALHQLTTYVFSTWALSVPQNYFSKLTGNPYASSDTFTKEGFPIRKVLSEAREHLLGDLFDKDRLARIANTEFITAHGAFRMLDLFTSVRTAVWSSLEKHEVITPFQRDLQHSHLQLMINLAYGADSSKVPPDARMLAWQTLRDLRKAIATALPAYKESYSRIHLEESLSSIDHALAGKLSAKN